MVDPRLGRYEGGAEVGSGQTTTLSAAERRGLRWAGAAAVTLVAMILWGTVPATGFLRDPQTGDLLRLPYSVTFLLGWTVLLVIWILLGLPVGPGAPLYIDDRPVM